MKKVLKVALLSALLSVLNLTIGEGDLRVSLGILVMIVSFFNDYEIDIIKTSLVTGLFVFLLRTFLMWINQGYNAHLLLSYSIEIIFYFSYGILYKYGIQKKLYLNDFPLSVKLVASDFLANYFEYSVRNSIFNINLSIEDLLFFLLASVLRSIAIIVILRYFQFLSVLLLKEEHEDRYTNLVLFMSKLDMESYLLQKTQDSIEELMSDAYSLYEKLSKENYDPAIKDGVLSIAKNIHEIKKENRLVLGGIKELAKKRTISDDGIYLKDLVAILDRTVRPDEGSKIKIKIDHFTNFYTDKHYHLLSIFRNLINNAIEAEDNAKLERYVHVVMEKQGRDFLATVEDNGLGISERKSDKIYKTGFSTKINYETGEVNRGLGLVLVKELVEKEFKGSIKLESEEGLGTKFTIRIPIEEVEKNANLHSGR